MFIVVNNMRFINSTSYFELFVQTFLFFALIGYNFFIFASHYQFAHYIPISVLLVVSLENFKCILQLPKPKVSITFPSNMYSSR